MIPNKRIYGIIGLPCSGKSTVIDTIVNGMKQYGRHIDVISASAIAKQLTVTTNDIELMKKNDLCMNEDGMRRSIHDKVESSNAEIILLDGVPRFGDQAAWFVNTFWLYNPTIIQAMDGDYSILYNRARNRARDNQDTDIVLFANRLARASKNMTDIENVIKCRFIPHYGIHSTENILKRFMDIRKDMGDE